MGLSASSHVLIEHDVRAALRNLKSDKIAGAKTKVPL